MHRFSWMLCLILCGCVFGPNWPGYPPGSLPPWPEEGKELTTFDESNRKTLRSERALDVMDRWSGRVDFLVLPVLMPDELRDSRISKLVAEFLTKPLELSKRVKVTSEHPDLPTIMREQASLGSPAYSPGWAINVGAKAGARFVFYVEVAEVETHVVQLLPPYAHSLVPPPGSWRVQGELKLTTTLVDVERAEIIHRRRYHNYIDRDFYEEPTDPEVAKARDAAISQATYRSLEEFARIAPVVARVVEVSADGTFVLVSLPQNYRRPMGVEEKHWRYGPPQIVERVLYSSADGKHIWYSFNPICSLTFIEYSEQGDMWCRIDGNSKELSIQVNDFVLVAPHRATAPEND